MHTRFDLAYSMRVLSRYAHNLSSTHCALVKQVLRYVVETINVDLIFERSNNQHSDDLIDYNDSNFVELKNTRHSTKDYVFMLVDETIIHSSKQQFIIVFRLVKSNIWCYSKQLKKQFESDDFLMNWTLKTINSYWFLQITKVLLISSSIRYIIKKQST
jgi:hypothetical protein